MLLKVEKLFAFARDFMLYVGVMCCFVFCVVVCIVFLLFYVGDVVELLC